MIKNLFLGLLCVLVLPGYAADTFEIPDRPAESGVITLQNPIGTRLQAYVAGPGDASLGILILHDRWGIDDTVRQWVDRFAAKGYRALAIDVFDGRQSGKMWLATEIMHASDPEWTKSDIKAGLAYLKRDGRKIVTLGAGYGGWQSFQAALVAPAEVAASVVIYGELDAEVEQFRALQSPLLTIFASEDEQIPSATVEEYRLLVKRSLIAHRSYSYPARHGFMDPRYPGYNADLTQEVWQQVDSFLADFVEG